MSIKKIAALALGALLLFAAFALAPLAEENCPRYADPDNTGVISADEAESLKAKLDSISEPLELDVAVLVVDNISLYNDSTGSEYTDYAVFAADYYEAHVYPGDYVSAAVLLYERDGNNVYILTIGEADECIDKSAMFNTLKDEYEANGYYAMFCRFADECDKIVRDYRANPESYSGSSSVELRGTLKSIATGGKPRFIDLGDTGLVTKAQQEEISNKLESLSAKLGMDLVAATVDNYANYEDTDGKAYDNYVDFADDLYDYYGDYAESGVLMLIVYINDYDRFWYISTKGTAENEVDYNTVGDDIMSSLKSGNYTKAFIEFADSCEKQVGDARSFHFVKKLIISLLIALIIAFIVVGSMKKQLTSVKFADQANDYVRPGSLNLTESRDTFLYSAVTRTVRETESRSGGGGGSHTSSSGSSHGGGGGRF